MTEIILLAALFVATFIGWCVVTYHVEMLNRRIDLQDERISDFKSNVQYKVDDLVRRMRKCEALVTDEVDEETQEAVKEASEIVHELQKELEEIQSL